MRALSLVNNGNWNWDVSSWNWGQIGLSALGGGVAGALSSISIGGSAIISWLGTILLGGIGSVAGGLISGSVTDWESAAWAFGIGAVANVAARGITTLINKGITASAQKALNNPIFDKLTFSDLVGSGVKNSGYNPAYIKILNQAAKTLMMSNGQLANSILFSFMNSSFSSLFSGWY